MARKTQASRYDKLRQRLRAEEGQLQHEIERLRAEAPALAEERKGAGFSTHMAEDAWGSYEREHGLGLEERLSALLAEVRHTLEKFERGTYGICDSCGKEIPFPRLEARPQANLCLECQAKKERAGRP
ncbi:MAG: TraR/DksA C4-type zinc finger protein [Chloroflexi bacterium]|nr:TraR/DksA C4-type zinc finger protein [Chloroflexota bacterium]